MLSKDNYLKTVRRPYPPLFCSMMMRGSSKAEYYRDVVNKPFAILDLIKSDETWYYSKKEFEQAGKLALESWRTPKVLQHALTIFRNREHELLTASQGSDLVQFINAYERYMPALTLVFMTDKNVAIAVRKCLDNNLSSSEAYAMMLQLNTPLEDNYYKQEAYELVTATDLDAHAQKYEWIHSRYGSLNPYTRAQAEEKLASLNKNALLQQREKDKRALKQTIERAKEILGPAHSNLIDLMQFIIFYRTQRTDVMNRSQYQFAHMLQGIATEHGITYDELLHSTRDEILNVLPSKEVLHERMEDHAMVMEQGVIRCVIGDECRKIREYLYEDLGDIREFKGTIACKGKVIGTVRLIKSREDFTRVNQGDILVTSMTTPEMVEIMKKAAAFVTDEGGITCHASIISREMNKPCVIGTKLATQVLMDGDKVEVDANTGVVRNLT